MEDKTNNHITGRDKDTRIVIIGAGAAGLTAASTLRDRGYHNIVILEREKRAGGKCMSVDIDGQLYELGGGMIKKGNTTVMSLVKKYAIRLERVPIGKNLILDRKNHEPRKKRTLKKTFVLIKELLTYRAVQKKYPHIATPGFADIDREELSMPFAEFAKKHRFEALAQSLELTFTGFGYGYFENVSTAYVLKYFSWNTVMSFVKHRLYFFPDGIEQLWTAIAKDFEVKYGAKIESIRRDRDISIRIQSADTDKPETIECDKLIVTSPLDEMLSYIDATSDEKKLFGDIKHVDYYTIACSVLNFPKMTGYAPGNFNATRAGHPVFWYHRHPETDIYTFYALGSGERMSDDELTQHIGEFVSSMGGAVDRIHTIKYWKYFPHVSPDKIKEGFYDSLEKIQGEQGTYYAGELMNFSTVGLTSQYAEGLVERFF